VSALDPVVSAAACPSHADDGFPLGGPLSDIPDRFRGLVQREGSVDDRRELAGFDEFLQDNQVLFLCLEKNERSRWPTNGDVTTARRVRPVPMNQRPPDPPTSTSVPLGVRARRRSVSERFPAISRIRS